MRVRAILFSLIAVAAVAVCGCSSESPYNIPADPAKEAAAINAGIPPSKVGVGARRKVTKPPGGGPLRASKNAPRSD
jgi:hypothetical protein